MCTIERDQNEATYGFWGAFNLNEAHTAVSGNGKSFVVAEPWNLNACFLTGLENGIGAVNLEMGAKLLEGGWESNLPALACRRCTH